MQLILAIILVLCCLALHVFLGPVFIHGFMDP